MLNSKLKEIMRSERIQVLVQTSLGRDLNPKKLKMGLTGPTALPRKPTQVLLF